MLSIESQTGNHLLELLVESARHVHPEGTLEPLVGALLRATLTAAAATEAVLVLTESGSSRAFWLRTDRPEVRVEVLPSPAPWSSPPDAGPTPLDEPVRRALGLPRSRSGRQVMVEFATGTAAMVVVGAAEEDDPRLALLARHAANSIGNLRACQQAEVEARIDGLTGAMNYRYFMRRVASEIDRAAAHEETFALLMVDVDNLKTYNDRHGHLGGSAALKELARLLEESARPVDVIAKYGGDEFSILLPDITPEAALRYCHDILERVEGHGFEGDPYRHLTITVGLAFFPQDGSEPRELLRQADDRLYRAKADGRNRIGVADSRVIART